MTLNHLSEFLIGPKSLPFERCLPVLKESPCPPFALVAPQLAEGLLEQVSGVDSLVGTKQGFQCLAAFQTQIVPARQQRVFLPFDEASIFTHHSSVLAFSNLIQRFAQMAHHMKFVVQNGGLGSTRFSGVSKRLPHVHHRQANPTALWLSQLIKKPFQALFRTVLAAKPDRSSLFQVAHDNAVRVPFANRYLVNADHLGGGLTRTRKLRLQVLLVQLFDRMPVQLEFLGHVLDS